MGNNAPVRTATEFEVATLYRIRGLLQDNSSQSLKVLFKRLWKAIIPSEIVNYSIPNPQWILIGFPEPNPKNSIRGFGCLALEQITFFAERFPTTFIHFVNQDLRTHPKQRILLARTGIQITYELCKLFDDGSAALPYWRLVRSEEMFHEFYVFVMLLLKHETLYGSQCEDFDLNKSIESLRVSLTKYLAMGPSTVAQLYFWSGVTTPTSGPTLLHIQPPSSSSSISQHGTRYPHDYFDYNNEQEEMSSHQPVASFVPYYPSNEVGLNQTSEIKLPMPFGVSHQYETNQMNDIQHQHQQQQFYQGQVLNGAPKNSKVKKMKKKDEESLKWDLFLRKVGREELEKQGVITKESTIFTPKPPPSTPPPLVHSNEHPIVDEDKDETNKFQDFLRRKGREELEKQGMIKVFTPKPPPPLSTTPLQVHMNPNQEQAYSDELSSTSDPTNMMEVVESSPIIPSSSKYHPKPPPGPPPLEIISSNHVIPSLSPLSTNIIDHTAFPNTLSSLSVNPNVDDSISSFAIDNVIPIEEGWLWRWSPNTWLKYCSDQNIEWFETGEAISRCCPYLPAPEQAAWFKLDHDKKNGLNEVVDNGGGEGEAQSSVVVSSLIWSSGPNTEPEHKGCVLRLIVIEDIVPFDIVMQTGHRNLISQPTADNEEQVPGSFLKVSLRTQGAWFVLRAPSPLLRQRWLKSLKLAVSNIAAFPLLPPPLPSSSSVSLKTIPPPPPPPHSRPPLSQTQVNPQISSNEADVSNIQISISPLKFDLKHYNTSPDVDLASEQTNQEEEEEHGDDDQNKTQHTPMLSSNHDNVVIDHHENGDDQLQSPPRQTRQSEAKPELMTSPPPINVSTNNPDFSSFSSSPRTLRSPSSMPSISTNSLVVDRSYNRASSLPVASTPSPPPVSSLLSPRSQSRSGSNGSSNSPGGRRLLASDIVEGNVTPRSRRARRSQRHLDTSPLRSPARSPAGTPSPTGSNLVQRVSSHLNSNRSQPSPNHQGSSRHSFRNSPDGVSLNPNNHPSTTEILEEFTSDGKSKESSSLLSPRIALSPLVTKELNKDVMSSGDDESGTGYHSNIITDPISPLVSSFRDPETTLSKVFSRYDDDDHHDKDCDDHDIDNEVIDTKVETIENQSDDKCNDDGVNPVLDAIEENEDDETRKITDISLQASMETLHINDQKHFEENVSGNIDSVSQKTNNHEPEEQQQQVGKNVDEEVVGDSQVVDDVEFPWTEHYSEEGYAWIYNEETGESKWGSLVEHFPSNFRQNTPFNQQGEGIAQGQEEGGVGGGSDYQNDNVWSGKVEEDYQDYNDYYDNENYYSREYDENHEENQHIDKASKFNDNGEQTQDIPSSDWSDDDQSSSLIQENQLLLIGSSKSQEERKHERERRRQKMRKIREQKTAQHSPDRGFSNNGGYFHNQQVPPYEEQPQQPYYQQQSPRRQQVPPYEHPQQSYYQQQSPITRRQQVPPYEHPQQPYYQQHSPRRQHLPPYEHPQQSYYQQQSPRRQQVPPYEHPQQSYYQQQPPRRQHLPYHQHQSPRRQQVPPIDSYSLNRTMPHQQQLLLSAEMAQREANYFSRPY